MTQLDPAAITSTPGKQVSSVSPQTLHNPSPPQSSLQQQWFSGEHGKMAQDTSENEATTVDLTRQDDHQEEADRPDSPIQQGAVDQPTLPESEDVQMNTNGQLPPELTQEGLFIQAMTRLTSVIRNLECLGGSADFPLSRDCYEFNHETKENQLSQVGVLVMTCQMANHYLYQYLRRQSKHDRPFESNLRNVLMMPQTTRRKRRSLPLHRAPMATPSHLAKRCQLAKLLLPAKLPIPARLPLPAQPLLLAKPLLQAKGPQTTSWSRPRSSGSSTRPAACRRATSSCPPPGSASWRRTAGTS